MKRIKKLMIIAAAGLLVALVLVKLVRNRQITQSRVYHAEKDAPVTISADTAGTKDLGRQRSFSGIFEPFKETRISAETQGKVNAVLVEPGDVVTGGQALVQLDNALLKLQLQAVEVQIEGLEADLKRYTVLAAADAVQGVQTEKTQLALKAALVQKASLNEQISKTTIRAPFSGVVTSKMTEAGSFAAPGVPLLQLSDLSTLRFTVYVNEKDLILFRRHAVYPVVPHAFAGTTLQGRVIMSGSKSGAGNSFPVQLSVNNTAEGSLRAGMFASVSISDTGIAGGIMVPSSAIVETKSGPHMYRVTQGRAYLLAVDIAGKSGDHVIVSSGLKAGEVFVTRGFVNLSDSARVIVK